MRIVCIYCVPSSISPLFSLQVCRACPQWTGSPEMSDVQKLNQTSFFSWFDPGSRFFPSCDCNWNVLNPFFVLLQQQLEAGVSEIKEFENLL